MFNQYIESEIIRILETYFRVYELLGSLLVCQATGILNIFLSQCRLCNHLMLSKGDLDDPISSSVITNSRSWYIILKSLGHHGGHYLREDPFGEQRLISWTVSDLTPPTVLHGAKPLLQEWCGSRQSRLWWHRLSTPITKRFVFLGSPEIYTALLHITALSSRVGNLIYSVGVRLH